jgi:hypothetical protein
MSYFIERNNQLVSIAADDTSIFQASGRQDFPAILRESSI